MSVVAHQCRGWYVRDAWPWSLLGSCPDEGDICKGGVKLTNGVEAKPRKTFAPFSIALNEQRKMQTRQMSCEPQRRVHAHRKFFFKHVLRHAVEGILTSPLPDNVHDWHASSQHRLSSGRLTQCHCVLMAQRVETVPAQFSQLQTKSTRPHWSRWPWGFVATKQAQIGIGSFGLCHDS